MILKATPTGRQWGDKRDAVTKSITVDGVKCILTEADSWFGPVEPGEKGQYVRMKAIEPEDPVKWWEG